MLLLYTDGVSEAQNSNGEFFDTERLLDAARTYHERTAQAVQDAILAAIDRFVGDAAQIDDLTVMALVRDPLF
jgi:sigma-B regulation protein RsbU (phosphoserine phosphatase)